MKPDDIASAGKALLSRIYIATLSVLAEQLENSDPSEVSAATLQAALKVLDQNAISLVALADQSSPLVEQEPTSVRLTDMPDFSAVDMSIYDEQPAALVKVSPAFAPFEDVAFKKDGSIEHPYKAYQKAIDIDPATTIEWS